MMMRNVIGKLLIAAVALTLTGVAMAEKESITVVRPDGAGGVQVISKEREVAEKARRSGPAVAASDKPRKARVVVMPAQITRERRRRIDRELNQTWGITDPGAIENPGYTSHLIDALVNARKFDMLEREELQELVKEMDFGESEYVDPAKAQKIGNMAGADYVIMPEIRYLETARDTKTVPYVGKAADTVKCKLATTVRTVSVSTGKIISSHISETEKTERFRSANNVSLKSAVLDLIGDVYKESAMKEAANIVDVAYPIRVMSVSGDVIMVNRGRGAIKKGQMLDIFSTGEMMVDPDTGESLGYSEVRVGKAKVIDVDLKTSKAQITERSGNVERLFICRRPDEEDDVQTLGTQPAPKID